MMIFENGQLNPWLVVFGVCWVSAMTYILSSLFVFLAVRRNSAYNGPDVFHSLQSHRWPGWLFSDRYQDIKPSLAGLVWLARAGFVIGVIGFAAMLLWPSSPWSLLRIVSGLMG